MDNSYASVNDVVSLWRPLNNNEVTRVTALLPVVSDALRQEAYKVGKDLDLMITDGVLLTNVVKAVTVDIVARVINTSTTAEPMSQMSQSALGYTVSGTYLVPGGGVLQILKNDLKRLGLKRQRFGVIEL